MKKNLRIVSAAAAALLAVAPIAATAMPVNAAAIKDITVSGNTPAIKGNVNVSANLKAVTKAGQTIINNNTGVVSLGDWDGTVTGTVSATVNGQSYTGNLAENTRAYVYTAKKLSGSGSVYGYEKVEAKNGKLQLKPGQKYFLLVPNVSFNFGSANANRKDLKIVGNGLQLVGNHAAATTPGFLAHSDVATSMNAWTSQNGDMTNEHSTTAVAQIGVLVPFTAVNTTNTRSVQFYEKSTGNVVTAGDVSLNANSNAQLNVNAVAAAINAKYGAHQYEYGNQIANAEVTTTVKDLTEQLNKAGMTVDAQGNFTANKSFSLTLNAKSGDNAYTNSMVVTVNVPNGKEATAAQEVTKNVTIMHIATIYDKNGKATTEPVLRAYNSQAVVSEPVTINGAKFYKLAGKDQYIKVGNVDGTKRTLKHNSYVYKSNGKAYTHKVGKKTKKVLKKSGSEVTTYGKSFMIHGSQMWRIGKNQYIKVRNF